MAKEKLRIGVFLDTPRVEGWVARTLREIKASRFAEFSLLVVRADSSHPRVTGIESDLTSPPSLLYRLYRHFDYRLFGLAHDAMAPEDVTGLFDGVTTLDATAGADSIASHDLDVALRFGSAASEIPRDCARYGVWSYRFAADSDQGGEAPLFWEIYRGNPVSGSALTVQSPELGPECRVIYRSLAGTEFRSLHRNRNPILWKSSAFMLRMLQDLHTFGWTEFLSRNLDLEESDPASHAVDRSPSNLHMVVFLARLIRRLGRHLFAKTFRWDTWHLAYRTDSISEVVRDPGLGISKFRAVSPPRGRLQADPFVTEREGRQIVFYEDLVIREGKGNIAWTEIDESGNLVATGIALDLPYHLSYPFLFEWKGDLFMMPETASHRTVEVYRCRSFPDAWDLESTPFQDIEAVDATIYERDGKFWLFMNVSECGGSTCDELFLYFGKSPLGPWTSHPKNPVVSDVRRSRPAGALFVRDRQLIRPSQDSAGGYGVGLNLNRVDVLTETDYQETLIEHVTPEAPYVGLHTLNGTRGLTVIDIMRPLRK